MRAHFTGLEGVHLSNRRKNSSESTFVPTPSQSSTRFIIRLSFPFLTCSAAGRCCQCWNNNSCSDRKRHGRKSPVMDQSLLSRDGLETKPRWRAQKFSFPSDHFRMFLWKLCPKAPSNWAYLAKIKIEKRSEYKNNGIVHWRAPEVLFTHITPQEIEHKPGNLLWFKVRHGEHKWHAGRPAEAVLMEIKGPISKACFL